MSPPSPSASLPAPESSAAEGFARKIPAVTLLFWVMKILATTLGETAADHVSKTLDWGYAAASGLFVAALAVTLSLQLLSKRYHPPIFWSVIASTSLAGTAMSDYMDRKMEVGYLGGSAILITILLAILATWRVTQKTISIDRITTRTSEIFYWTAILFSNTLGTALGDYLADEDGPNLGFAGGAIAIGGALVLVALAYRLTKLSRVALFWLAFILTRPFGATMGDVLAREHDEGGLGFGTSGSSLVLGGALVALVVYETLRLRRAAGPAT